MSIRSARRAVGNALSVLTSAAVTRATTFVLYALVARRLGTFEFGQMSLALTFFFLFQVLAVAGLRILITRDVAADRTQTDKYLVNGSLVVIISSLMSSVIMFIIVKFLRYPPDTASVILMLSFGLIPLSLSAVFEAVFQGWEKMGYIAYANVPVNIAKIVLAPLMLARGSGINHLIILLLASYAATAVIEWHFILRNISRPQLRISPGFTLKMIGSSRTFLGMDVVIAFLSSMNVIMLSKMGGESDVGIYSAAHQLLVPVSLVQASISASAFPAMCRRFGSSLSGLTEISERLMELLVAISLPSAVGLFFLAEPALLLLYRDHHFLLASDVLRILVWGILMTSLTSVLGGVLLAGGQETTTLRIVAVDTLLNLVLGLALISKFGLIGAAVSTILMKLVDLFMHYVPVARLLPNLPVGRLAWKPAVASGCMAAYLRMVPNQNLILTVVSAAAIYVGILLALLVWSHGGLGQFRARYLYLRAE